MDEATGFPLIGLAAHRHLAAVQHLVGPRLIVAQVGDQVIVLVQDRHAGVQIGHQQIGAANIKMRGEAHALYDG